MCSIYSSSSRPLPIPDLFIIALVSPCPECHIVRIILYVTYSWTLFNPTWNIFGLPYGSEGKESACNAGDLGSIPELGRFPGGGHGNPLQYSCLENSHGQRSLVGYSSWGLRVSDMTEWLSTHRHTTFNCFHKVYDLNKKKKKKTGKEMLSLRNTS